MYNGVGVSTARGTGTNGYVQKNLSHIRHKKELYDYSKENNTKAPHQTRLPNPEILEHERKRSVEVKCLEFRDQLEAKADLLPEDVDRRVNELRQKLLESLNSRKVVAYLLDHAMNDSHVSNAVQTQKMNDLAAALRIPKDFKAGDSMRNFAKPSPSASRPHNDDTL